MKYFITLLAVLFFVPASPSNLEIYNNTTSNLYYKIGARPSNGNMYPLLYSLGPTGHFLFLSSGTGTSYMNVGGFPFYSPTSLPIITNWERQLTATSTPVNTASSIAQSIFGATHRYCQFKFYIENSSGIVTSSGNLDPLNLDNSYELDLADNIRATYIPVGQNVFILFDTI